MNWICFSSGMTSCFCVFFLNSIFNQMATRNSSEQNHSSQKNQKQSSLNSWKGQPSNYCSHKDNEIAAQAKRYTDWFKFLDTLKFSSFIWYHPPTWTKFCSALCRTDTDAQAIDLHSSPCPTWNKEKNGVSSDTLVESISHTIRNKANNYKM